jgi:hypothetical protein
LIIPDKRAKPGRLPKSNALSEIREIWIEKNLIFKGLNLIHLLLDVNKNTHLTPNVVVAKEAAYLAHCEWPVRRADQITHTHARTQHHVHFTPP